MSNAHARKLHQVERGTDPCSTSALQELAPEVETVSTTTFRAEDAADTGYREDLLALGFAEAEMLEEFGYPTQRLLAAKSVLKEACDAR